MPPHKAAPIDAGYIRTLFDYDSDKGVLIWKYKRRSGRVGKPAGSTNKRGYVFVIIDTKYYYAHRLVWAWHHGDTPLQIDHINGIKDDNRIENLRVATNSQNNMNLGTKKNNKSSGVKNVTWHAQANKWAVQVVKNGIVVYRGWFTELADAEAAAKEARKEHHGEFAY